jgi:asparagine synthase (glutamine-hydrolysing)
VVLFGRGFNNYATVALSGECADELFGGYPWYRNPETLKEASFPWAKRTAYRLSFVRDGVLDGVDPEAFIRERYDATADDADVYEADSDDERALKRMVRLNTDWFMQTLLDRKDRMSMFSGLEVRVPFCDHRIAEYLYNVPSAFKNFEGREKGLLREALTGALPESVRLRKKSPYPKTHHPEYMKRVSEMLLDILASANSPLLEIADRSALSAAALSKGENSEPWYGQLMTAPQTIAYFIQLNYWMIKYGVEIDF